MGITQLKRILKNLLSSAFQLSIQTLKKDYFKRHVHCLSSYLALAFTADILPTVSESAETNLSDIVLAAIVERRSHCKHYNDVLGLINFCAHFLSSKSIVALSKSARENTAFVALWTTVLELVGELADTFCEMVPCIHTYIHKC